MADLMSPIGPSDGTDINTTIPSLDGRSDTPSPACKACTANTLSLHDLNLVAVRTGFSRPKGKLRNVDLDVYHTVDLALDLVGARDKNGYKSFLSSANLHFRVESYIDFVALWETPLTCTNQIVCQ